MINVSDTFKTAIHADQRFIKAEATFHFSSGTVTFTSDDLLREVKILEEIGSENGSPLGNITSNECFLSFDNAGREFSRTNKKSLYYGQLKPNIRFDVKFLVETSEDVFERINAGTYYTGDWESPTGAIEASVTGYDRLINLIDQPVTTSQVKRNVSAKSLFEHIFQGAGIKSDEYIIDDSIDFTIPIAWVPSGTFGEAVQRLADASFACVFVNRNNKVRVKSLIQTGTSVDEWNDDNQIFEMDNPQKYLNIFSAVQLSYYITTMKKNKEILNLSGYELESGINEFKDLSLMNPIAAIDRIEIKGAANCELNDIEYLPDKLSISLSNTGSNNEVDIIIYGNIIESTGSLQISRDAKMIAEYGEKIIELDNMYVQNETRARALTQNILKISSDPSAYFTLDVRGNPSVELLDCILIRSDYDEVETQEIALTRIELNYDGALSGYVEGRKPIRE